MSNSPRQNGIPGDSAAFAFISIIIVSLNGEAVLPACLASIDKLEWPRDRLEIILVNNGSSDSTGQIAEEWRNRRVIPVHLSHNAGFAGGNNEGLRVARGDWMVLLNDDTELPPDWARIVFTHAGNDTTAGILGSILLYPDSRTIQHAGGIIQPNALTAHIGQHEEDTGQFAGGRECDYITGACMAIRRDVVQRIGLLDPGYFPIYFEEIDYCRRARKAGFRIVMTCARAIHHESRTTVALSAGFLRKYHRNRLRFVAMNYGAREGLQWARAEAHWLRHTRKWLPKSLLAGVYFRALAQLPGWMMKRTVRTRALRKL